MAGLFCYSGSPLDEALLIQRFIILALAIFLVCLAGAGSATVPMASLRAGARALAIGEAGAAALQGDEATWWNAAGIAGDDGISAGLQHTSWPGPIDTELAQFGMPLAPGRLSLWGLYGSSAGAEPRAEGFGGAWGMELGDGVRAGMSATGFQQALAGKSDSEFVLQPAVQATLGPLVFGVAYFAPGVGTKAWQASLAADWVIDRLRTTLSGGYMDLGPASRYGIGLELGWENFIFIRTGFENHSDTRAVEGQQGMSGGLGFAWWGYSVDYGVQTLGALGLAHRASLNYHWSRMGRGEAPPELRGDNMPLPPAEGEAH